MNSFNRTLHFEAWILIFLALKCSCKKDLYVGGLISIDVSKGGWSSAGVLPAVQIALEDINNSTEILKDYELKMIPKDTKVSSQKGSF
jgi:gamma-aminobutyric acid type B receptor